MPDILTLRELLIDFVPTISGVTLIDAPTFNVDAVDTMGAEGCVSCA